MMSRFSLRKTYMLTNFFSTIHKYAPNVFNALYYKFRLVQLRPILADLVTIYIIDTGPIQNGRKLLS